MNLGCWFLPQGPQRIR